MGFVKNTNLNIKINNNQDSDLQNYIELFWKQLRQQVPIWGCILVAQQDKSQNIIEAICLSRNFEDYKINYTLLNNLELNFYKSESVIHFESEVLGYIYTLTTTKKHSRYLIFFCNNDNILSLTQKQIIKNYNQLLQQYLNLEDKYQKKQNEFKTLESLFYQMGHHLKNRIAEISIIAETICLSSTTSFCQFQAEDIKKKIINVNLDIRDFLRSYKQVNNHENSQNISQDIRKIFQESVDNFKNLINDKNIKVKYPQQTAFLAIDSFKLKQIFDNLLSNAIYFSPQGETIDCYWQSFQEEIIISICDQGCGLSSEDIQNMFLPFYSHRKNGQGLGLAIIKKIILDLKGNIWAENIPQGGTKISFVLPK